MVGKDPTVRETRHPSADARERRESGQGWKYPVAARRIDITHHKTIEPDSFLFSAVFSVARFFV